MFLRCVNILNGVRLPPVRHRHLGVAHYAVAVPFADVPAVAGEPAADASVVVAFAVGAAVAFVVAVFVEAEIAAAAACAVAEHFFAVALAVAFAAVVAMYYFGDAPALAVMPDFVVGFRA